ncbi:murein hydrolase activator EnvC family protein [Roseinatronobacter alkalisoli]|uniref:Peptidoglycan DD-metalloendopeptidase family protein n=1 Tax=Roseinatronobacter alkalisoli TaxID=3028235 RepID=A0ABT5T609_9RHOB|nr:peptidoglycan DD-metalloendopeptidase family protein [Roseinatronobacter sp. HJB301]MDD7969677.1 peptidoglycan DD-metalloendopeptidase family protein [Roseinatronobacter sp. HJB301]
MIRAALITAGLMLASLPALGHPADRAMAAARALQDAGAELQQASSGRDRIAALSLTIQAYEDGMVALREGLRDVQLREATMASVFSARGGDLARLLAVLMATDRVDAASALVHPSGALEAARTAQLLGELAPGLGAEVAALRDDLQELRALRRARQYGLLALEQGLGTAQEARIALAQAIADRGPLPKRLIDAPERLQILAQDAATLDEFAAELALGGVAALANTPVASLAAAHGTLDLPVRATVLRRFNQPDAAGIARPGLVLATTPEALVTAPWSGTVRYAGPLAGQGNTVILEPAENKLMVLVGLGGLMVENGEILPRGAPLGTMPAAGSDAPGTGTRNQTLYFEMRDDGNTIDPEPWFAFTARQEPE